MEMVEGTDFLRYVTTFDDEASVESLDGVVDDREPTIPLGAHHDAFAEDASSVLPKTETDPDQTQDLTVATNRGEDDPATEVDTAGKPKPSPPAEEATQRAPGGAAS